MKTRDVSIVAFANNSVARIGESFPWTHPGTLKPFIVNRMQGRLLQSGAVHLILEGTELKESAQVKPDSGEVVKPAILGDSFTCELTVTGNVIMVWWADQKGVTKKESG